MRITFINPNFTNRKSFDAMEPLVFAILAAHTPPDIETVFYDERIEAIRFDTPTDLVAVSVQTFTAKRAYNIASEYRKRGVPVVLGGIHPTLVPEEAGAHCDAVAVGEAEDIWLQIVADARQKKLKPVYRSSPTREKLVTRFDRSIFRGKKYQLLTPVQFGRGCRFACDFCCVHVLYQSKTRNRSVDDFIAEIRSISSPFLFFVDDNLPVNFDDFRTLMKEMALLKKHFVCQISIDAAMDDETLSLLKNAGCMTAFIGFESFSDEDLRRMGKSPNRSGSYDEVIDRFYAHGIMVVGSFVFGYDHDSKESMYRALDFAMRKKLCLAHFNMIYPYPGTRLYARLKEEQKLVFDTWWTDDSCEYSNCLFYPKNMKPDELASLCQDIRRKFNSLPSIFNRSLNLPVHAHSLWHFIAYWGSNLVNRKEVKNKITMEIG